MDKFCLILGKIVLLILFFCAGISLSIGLGYLIISFPKDVASVVASISIMGSLFVSGWFAGFLFDKEK